GGAASPAPRRSAPRSARRRPAGPRSAAARGELRKTSSRAMAFAGFWRAAWIAFILRQAQDEDAPSWLQAKVVMLRVSRHEVLSPADGGLAKADGAVIIAASSDGGAAAPACRCPRTSPARRRRSARRRRRAG